VRGVFVTGTDTGVGKTVLAGALVAALRAQGEPVRALKPVLTGLDVDGGQRDDELLARCAGVDAEGITLARFGAAASPQLAAELEGRTLDVPALLDATRAALDGPVIAVVEGVGGLLVPLTREWDVRDFAAALGLPLLIAARPGLGTVNHTLLTLEAARAANLDVLAVVLTPWPANPSSIELSNEATIARVGNVETARLEPVHPLQPAALAAGGAGLPLKRWFRPPTPLP
jgi:dethiobiotin synthetase